MATSGRQERELAFTGPRGSLSALWRDADDPIAVAVLAHGAGSDMRNQFLDGVVQGLAGGHVSAMRFNFPFTEEGRKSPDRAPVLIEAWGAALAEAGRHADGLPLAAGGKSLGGRMASMLAAEEPESFLASALVFFGYPLHAPGRTDKPRVEHLAQIQVPMLFIQGTSDPLANFPMVQEVVRGLEPLARLHVVEGGDHSFRVRGARRPDDEIGRELGQVAATFIERVVAV
jgi:predicted alpha/beta-hydrolase family hydrolase